tara:strand:+ start:122 stop:301 length:180 start_codon:yes stop_codon:yes gene_type:complete
MNTNDIIDEAILWLCDLSWRDVTPWEAEEDLREMTKMRILTIVDKMYDGGLKQFIIDSE